MVKTATLKRLVLGAMVALSVALGSLMALPTGSAAAYDDCADFSLPLPYTCKMK